MDARHMSELIKIESGYWWHVSKRRLVTELLSSACTGSRVLECGVGGGMMLSVLKQRGFAVSGFDISPQAVAHCHEIGIDNVFVQDIAKPWPEVGREQDCVIMLDVLEHCEDPVAVLAEVRKALKPDGSVIITVPARPELMGPWDEMLGHYRRYSSDELRRQAADAGFEVSWLSGWNAFSLPIAYVLRGLDRFRKNASRAEFPKVPRLLNALLIKIADVERFWLVRHGLEHGLSIAAVLKPDARRKPDPADRSIKAALTPSH